MRVAVLGAGGLLGRHLVEELRGQEVRAFDRRACDLGELAQVQKAARDVDVVINCAAYTNVDGAEREPDAAYRANALGAEHAARAAAESGARLLHLSTDFVFDGAQPEPYDEFSVPNPLSVYARSKWAGEQLVMKWGGRPTVVRVQGLYGAGGGNFASKLHELLLAKKPLKLDGERRVQPTWARAAARQLVQLAAVETAGIYHVSCGGETTWAGFAGVLAERLGLPRTWEEIPTSALKAPAARPPNCLFAHRMLALHGLGPMPAWQVSLDHYLAEVAPR